MKSAFDPMEVSAQRITEEAWDVVSEIVRARSHDRCLRIAATLSTVIQELTQAQDLALHRATQLTK